MAFLNESHIEEADIQFFLENLNYDKHIDAWEKQLVGRDSLKDVVLRDRLKRKLIDLNPKLPLDAIDEAVHELCKSRAMMTPTLANKEVYELIKTGVPLTIKNQENREENAYVKVIDFENSVNNDFVVMSQLSILYQSIGAEYDKPTRRPDLLL